MNAASQTDLLRIHDLRIEDTAGDRKRTLVSRVSLTVAPDETVGIVGESGSGKSLTAKAILGLLPGGLAASGSITYRGEELLGAGRDRQAKLRGRDIGMVFQDPFTMLNPLHRCGAHIAESLRQTPRDARRGEVERRLDEVGIRDAARVARRYPFQLSGGMRQRIGIAAALAGEPALLVADEPTTALDVTTQAEILTLLRQLQARHHMGLIFITHDLRLAFSMCDRVYVFYAGTVVEVSPAAAMERQPLHPYTRGLLQSEPPLARRLKVLPEMAGSVPRPDDVAGRCPFVDRCEWSTPECMAGDVHLAAVAGAVNRASACVRLDDIRDQLVTAPAAAADHSEAGAPEAADSDALLVVENLSKTFGSGAHAVHALNGVSLTIRPGESVGLVGESGSGKTTLGRCVVGLEQPAGRVALNGVDVTSYRHLPARERKRARTTVQMIFQDPYSTLNPARTIGSTLAEAVKVAQPDVTDVRAEVASLLRSVGLAPDSAGRRPAALSGGQRQRVAIARALAAKPRLIVCDEPVSALDVSVQAQILNLLNKIRVENGIALLFITHDIAVVRQVADRVYVLYRGEMVEDGPAGSVLDNPQHDYTRQLVGSVPGRTGGEASGDIAAAAGA